MNQVVDDIGTGAGWPPTGSALQLGRRADEDGHVDAAYERGIGGNLGGRADSQQDFIRQFTHAHTFPAADIVDLSLLSISHQKKIGLDYIGDVKVVPNRMLVSEW
jgi:hypothetical protein